jgi:RND family efflux transporter MFP subunit
MTPYARFVLCAVALVSLGFGACSQPGTAGKTDAPPAAEPAASRPPVAVSVTRVAPGTFVDDVSVVGTLAPKFAADVKSELSGTVTAVFVTEWVSVRKGTPLAKLDTSEEVAFIETLKATVSQAKVGEARAKREYERAQQLKQFGLITPQAFDDAQSAVEAAQAATAAANAQVRAAETRLQKASIASPMDGVVAYRGVSVGDRVENMGGNGPMFRIVDSRVLDLTFSVPSSRLAGVKVGQAITFTADALPGRPFTGKVMFINPEIDAASRSAKVVAEVINRDGALKGGMFAKGRIVVASREAVLQVPREALLSWNLEQRSAEVWVVTGDQVEKRTVTTGASTDGTVEVLTGLQAGEQVVTRGGFNIRAGDRVTVAAGEGA